MKFSLRHFALALLLAGWSVGCSSTPPAPAPVVQTGPQGDDARLVSKEEFLTERTDWASLGNVVSWKAEGPAVTFELTGGRTAQLSFPAPNLYRLRTNAQGDYSRETSYAVVKTVLAPVELKTEDSPEVLTLSTGSLTVTVKKAGFLLTASQNGKVLAADTAGIKVSGNRAAVFRQMAAADRIFGLGEKAAGLLRNGKAFKNWNTDAYGYQRSTDPLYLTIPFFFNAGADGVTGTFFDNTYQSFFDFGKTNPGELYFGSTGGGVDYWFMAEKDVAALTRTFATLTGKLELPPRWALGYQQSRYSYETQDEVMELAKTFREKKLPADVIYLDIGFMDQNKAFTYNPENFPDPKTMLADLKKMGFKVITIIDPGMAVDDDYPVFASGDKAGVFIKDSQGKLVVGRVWPGLCAFPDFGLPATQAWWTDQYRGLLDLGIDAIWNDMDEPSVFSEAHKTLPWDARTWDFGQNSLTAKTHNVYGLEMAKATLTALNTLRPTLRPFLLNRAGYVGNQRYGAVWTGDNTSNWDHLALNLTMVLSLGLSGLPLTGADVGGYKDSPDQELFTRWMQLGALLPFYRNHTQNGTEPQEPWQFGEDYLPYIKAAMDLRYELLPYFYDLTVQASRTGEPLVRPLFYSYAQDKKVWEIEDEFLIGEDLLAAPVLKQGQGERTVYFPAGQVWFDWYTGKEYVGGKSYNLEAPLERVLLFARGGGVIPTQEVEDFVGQKASNPVELRIYPGGSGSHALIRDDGVTKAYKQGDFLETRWTYTAQGRDMTVTVANVNKALTYRPKDKYVLVRLPNVKRPQAVLVDGKPVTLYGDSGGVTESDKSAAWYEHDYSLLVKVFNPDVDQTLTIRY